MKPDWFPDWSGSIAAVIASGESAKTAGVELLRGRCRVLVVNNGFELAPWADALYAVDPGWWDAYPKARDFAGLKITHNPKKAARYGIHAIEVMSGANRLVFEPLGMVGHCGNGGFQGFNLAVQFGPARLMLVGFDFKGRHWHDDHVMPLRNPKQAAMDKWRERLDAVAPVLAEHGIEVVNCSPISALMAFERLSIKEALGRWGVAV